MKNKKIEKLEKALKDIQSQIDKLKDESSNKLKEEELKQIVDQIK